MLVGQLEIGAADPTRPISDEYQIKAVFLFNFAQFVEWPTDAFASAQAPIVIGIFGLDPFEDYLDELVKGEHVGSRPLLVHRYKTREEIAGCHILFVSRSEEAEVRSLLDHLKRRPILTISDVDTFTREGGIIRFATENGKIRLKINVEVAKASGLAISSKILRPAALVTAGTK
ncbi:MAG: YfiR family protein [Opitutus sp.]